MSDKVELIPGRFWATVTPEEFKQILEQQNGCLNAEQCARLWRMEDRNTEPPQQLEVVVSRADLDKLYPVKPRKVRRRGLRP